MRNEKDTAAFYKKLKKSLKNDTQWNVWKKNYFI